VPHPLGLPEVAVVVAGEDPEAGAEGEADDGDEGVAEADAVDVAVAGALDDRADGGVAGDEAVGDGEIEAARDGPRDGRRLGLRFLGIGLDVVAEEPAAEPADDDGVDRLRRPALERFEHRGDVDLVAEAEVLEALTDAPAAVGGLPVQVVAGKSFGEASGAGVGAVELAEDLAGPVGDGGHLGPIITESGCRPPVPATC